MFTSMKSVRSNLRSMLRKPEPGDTSMSEQKGNGEDEPVVMNHEHRLGPVHFWLMVLLGLGGVAWCAYDIVRRVH